MPEITKVRILVLCLTLSAICLWTAIPAYADELSDRDRAIAASALQHAGKSRWESALFEAARAKNPLIKKLLQWMYYKAPETTADFDELSAFVRHNKDWPQQNTLRSRVDEALLTGGASEKEILNWLHDFPPRERYDSTVPESFKNAAEAIRMLWIHGDYDAAEQKAILTRYKDRLRRQDHTARAERLLWEEKTRDAERLLPLLSTEDQKLYQARIGLIRDSAGINALLRAVPASRKNDPGLLYDRMIWRKNKKLTDGVREILLQLPANVPYASKWWPTRAAQARDALEKGDLSLAKKLLSRTGKLEGAEAADAQWMVGWMYLYYLKQPAEAYKSFYKLYHQVEFPVSKARGAYWAAEAATLNKNKEIAKRWYQAAARYPTTFYGQLALQTLNGNKPLKLPNQPQLSDRDRKEFRRRELARMVEMLAEINRYDLAERFAITLAENSHTTEEAALAAEIGKTIDRPHIGVKSAKVAIRKNKVLLASGHPRISIPFAAPIETALIHAITRQESEFDRNAKSPSGARGLMQLMPATAKKVAKKLGIPYSEGLLSLGEPNLRMGSTYLGQMIDGFDGSYILAICAYNAGPGNVRKWLTRFGNPGRDARKAAYWIEQIPFGETRNYVQRVLENLQVYRQLESPKNPLGIANDLVR